MNKVKYIVLSGLFLPAAIPLSAHAISLQDLVESIEESITPKIAEQFSLGQDFLDELTVSIKEQVITEENISSAQVLISELSNIADQAIDEVKDLGDLIDGCLRSSNTEQCSTAVLNPQFIESCQAIAFEHVNSLLLSLDSIKTNKLNDVVEQNNLYPAITRIFEQDLKTPGFTSYVKNNVEHYESYLVEQFADARAVDGRIYYKTDSPSPGLIIHELYHVWQQYTQGDDAFTEGYCDAIYEEKDIPTYEFILDPNQPLSDYNPEQQAEIIKEYYNYSEAGKTGCTDIDNFYGCNSLPADKLPTFRAVITGEEDIAEVVQRPIRRRVKRGS